MVANLMVLGVGRLVRSRRSIGVTGVTALICTKALFVLSRTIDRVSRSIQLMGDSSGMNSFIAIVKGMSPPARLREGT